jgi:hypothetical protein
MALMASDSAAHDVLADDDKRDPGGGSPAQGPKERDADRQQHTCQDTKGDPANEPPPPRITSARWSRRWELHRADGGGRLPPWRAERSGFLRPRLELGFHRALLHLEAVPA